IQALINAYHEHKKQKNILDFDDLLKILVRLLEENRRARAEIVGQYKFIMVDEYQDTNLVQARLVKLLGGEHSNVMVVGDDAQAIYSFRGTNCRSIFEFQRLFPGARCIKLERNYRSVQPILDVTNKVISGSIEKELKAIRSGGRTPKLIEVENSHAQTRKVVSAIRRLLNSGVRANEIAVLFRSGYESYEIETEMQRAGIRFVKRGGMKFSEQAHIRDILAFLRLGLDIKNEVSWHRVLTLHRGIGDGTGAELAKVLVDAGEDPPSVRMEALARHAKGARLRKAAEIAIGLAKTIEAAVREVSPAKQYKLVSDYYIPLLKANYPDPSTLGKRISEIQMLAGIAGRTPSLDEMANSLALDPPDEREDDRGKVVLSTVHSAKGLEWRCVYLIWAVDGRFPLTRLDPFDARTSEDSLEEERRLMYVALTRAMEHLAIFAPTGGANGGSGKFEISRFLRNVPCERIAAGELAIKRARVFRPLKFERNEFQRSEQ